MRRTILIPKSVEKRMAYSRAFALAITGRSFVLLLSPGLYAPCFLFGLFFIALAHDEC